jgi:hypothetical protein
MLLITTPPPLDYYVTALRSLGFQEVPGLSHFAYDGRTSTMTFTLDTKGDKLFTLLNNWISSAYSDNPGPSNPASVRLPMLTPREQEVAELLILGHTNA